MKRCISSTDSILNKMNIENLTIQENKSISESTIDLLSYMVGLRKGNY